MLLRNALRCLSHLYSLFNAAELSDMLNYRKNATFGYLIFFNMSSASTPNWAMADNFCPMSLSE